MPKFNGKSGNILDIGMKIGSTETAIQMGKAVRRFYKIYTTAANLDWIKIGYIHLEVCYKDNQIKIADNLGIFLMEPHTWISNWNKNTPLTDLYMFLKNQSLTKV